MCCLEGCGKSREKGCGKGNRGVAIVLRGCGTGCLKRGVATKVDRVWQDSERGELQE